MGADNNRFLPESEPPRPGQQAAPLVSALKLRLSPQGPPSPNKTKQNKKLQPRESQDSRWPPISRRPLRKRKVAHAA